MSIAYLTDTSGGQRYTLQKPATTIGRIDTCDIVIGQPKVSRQHAAVIQRGSNWFLQDLNSSNGVAVNGRRIPASTDIPIHSGDVITLSGIVGLRFETADTYGQTQYSADPFSHASVPDYTVAMDPNQAQQNYNGAAPGQQRYSPPVSAQKGTAGAPPVYQGQASGISSLKDYIEKIADQKTRSNIMWGAVIMYITCGITLLAAVISGSLGSLIDVALILPLAIIMHIKKSKGCAIALTVIGAFELIATSVSYGKLAGWLPMVGAATALAAFLKADKEYKQYTNHL